MDTMPLPVTVGRHRSSHPLLIFGFLTTLTLGCLSDSGDPGQSKYANEVLGSRGITTTDSSSNNRIGKPMRTFKKENGINALWWRYSSPTMLTAGLRTGPGEIRIVGYRPSLNYTVHTVIVIIYHR